MKVINHCEVCNYQDLESVLNLGSFPLCDDLIPISSSRISMEYPIEILLCPQCLTAHQKYQVPKIELFPKSYHYRSRFTADVVDGMTQLVDSVNGLFKFDGLKGRKVLDIGSNDGTLLNIFRNSGAITIGIEPTDAALESENMGHYIYQAYLDISLAEEIFSTYGFLDVITFTNVFAHIDDLPMLIESLNKLMGPNTLLVIENHYLGAVLSQMQFDTFYHEHPRTYSAKSFTYIAESLGARIIKVEFPKRYGGNIRIYISKILKENSKTDLNRIIREEENLFFKDFVKMNKAIARYIAKTSILINNLVLTYGMLPAKAFPGRAAILVKMLGLSDRQISAVYEKPGSKKIGNFLPGSRIPIKSDAELLATTNSLPIINLAWHIGPEIAEYLRSLGYNGKIINIIDQDSFL